jgi:hypothetical protein
MHLRRTQLALAALPVFLYVLLLVLVAALYVKPPAVGWIGLGVVAAVGVALVGAAAFLFPRMRRNVAEEAVASAENRVLVLADTGVSPQRLTDALASHVGPRAAVVHVVAPVLPSALHYLSGDEHTEEGDARRRLDSTLLHLHRAGIDATGALGADDPLQALGDALATFGAGEVLIVAHQTTHWLEDGLVEDAARLFPRVRQIVMASDLAA